ncbi:TRAM domain-containing protein [Leptolyngbya sp. 7M]|uniref:TRAM domain-containing protein n=1 Tax=Leptolyngbya sp. 7M TaxID=2812896 RepID=UPI0029391D61|nr:TRAM domain-containing protein [Leptolyngbya sp. 7M]
MGQSTEDKTLEDKTLEDKTLEPDGVWQQGHLLEVTIVDLNHNGEGVGRWQGRVVFVPGTVPGERVLVRLVRVKPQYAQGKLHELVEPSPHRVRPSCIVADKCGGCQWQHVDYGQQLAAKRNLVIQDLERIGGFSQPVVEPVLAVADPLGYRNKATYPIKVARPIKAVKPEPVRAATSSQSGKQRPRPILKAQVPSPNPTVQVQAGYYQKGSHQLINLNQCPIQDPRLNPFLAEIKQDIQQQGWSIYNETTHQGEVRHLGLRIGRRTGEVLLTLVVRSGDLPNIEQQASDQYRHQATPGRTLL